MSHDPFQICATQPLEHSRVGNLPIKLAGAIKDNPPKTSFWLLTLFFYESMPVRSMSRLFLKQLDLPTSPFEVYFCARRSPVLHLQNAETIYFLLFDDITTIFKN